MRVVYNDRNLINDFPGMRKQCGEGEKKGPEGTREKTGANAIYCVCTIFYLWQVFHRCINITIYHVIQFVCAVCGMPTVLNEAIWLTHRNIKYSYQKM